jgi:hypothetical protein
MGPRGRGVRSSSRVGGMRLLLRGTMVSGGDLSLPLSCLCTLSSPPIRECPQLSAVILLTSNDSTVQVSNESIKDHN